MFFPERQKPNYKEEKSKMGKISPISIKYTIFAKFSADGPVEKPDVIGAIFGQTEGLLGEELELRELQKNGKIGRIEVNIEVKDSKSEGEIQIPTSIDKTETTIIAAAIETIDRVGPCTAKVEITKIDDVRGGKRDFILGRAKTLLEKMTLESPDSREMQSTVAEAVRTGRVVEYGPEKLPAGPDMENPEIIVVEGRADVVNLLNYNLKNVIAMNGVSLPKTITELGKTKELTLFVDGDRGGELITKDALANANIKYIAIAPPGREVEELSGKEILVALRAKIKAEEFSPAKRERDFRRGSRDRDDEDRDSRGRGRYGGRGRFGRGRDSGGGRGRFGSREGGYGDRESESREGGDERKETGYGNEEMKEEKIDTSPAGEASADERSKLKEVLKSIEGTNAACLLDKDLVIVKKMSSNDLVMVLRRRRVYAIVMDGLATAPMIKAAEMAGCKRFVAKNFSSIEKTNMDLMSL